MLFGPLDMIVVRAGRPRPGQGLSQHDDCLADDVARQLLPIVAHSVCRIYLMPRTHQFIDGRLHVWMRSVWMREGKQSSMDVPEHGRPLIVRKMPRLEYVPVSPVKVRFGPSNMAFFLVGHDRSWRRLPQHEQCLADLRQRLLLRPVRQSIRRMDLVQGEDQLATCLLHPGMRHAWMAKNEHGPVDLGKYGHFYLMRKVPRVHYIVASALKVLFRPMNVVSPLKGRRRRWGALAQIDQCLADAAKRHSFRLDGKTVRCLNVARRLDQLLAGLLSVGKVLRPKCDGVG